MKTLIMLWICQGILVGGIKAADTHDSDARFQDLQDQLDKAKQSLSLILKQLVSLQISIEERTKLMLNQGIQFTRTNEVGPRPYYDTSHLGVNQAIAMHRHANQHATPGLGQFTVILNGVQFRTRHIDYTLVVPSSTSNKWHATEEVTFPELPPAVLEKPTLEEQIVEMKLWFKAFKEHDTSEREYHKYFQPLMCYLEGAWINSGKKESFESDRHALTATWLELQDVASYAAYAGMKDINEI